MPKISAPTVAEHREQRRAALLDAAAALILRSGNFTVAEVATEVGLSRSAVYEYYSSASDLIADVLVDELADWSDALDRATRDHEAPGPRIEAWVTAVLEYVSDGRHALVRAAGSVDLPPTRRAEVQTLHRDLIRPLHAAITDLGVADAGVMSGLVWGVVDSTITRLEAGTTTAEEALPVVLAFIQGGLNSSVLGRL
ncbi:MAG TPA: TetR family transcriptional regulator [Actinobacteria bacterium]|jgi:AcrR family transcriptional regulator|nr:TetR family transcriptional regulator [Actinomycetota bacterium]